MKLFDIIFESVVDMYEFENQSQDNFIKRAKEIHKDEFGNPKYGYDHVNYVNNYTNVIVTCPKHGDFPQNPSNHIKKINATGCKNCAFEKRKDSKEDFIKKSQKIHQDEKGNPLYTYNHVNYVNSRTLVNITCPIHGDFPQTPSDHKGGHGCRKCKSDKRRLSKDEFIKRSQEEHNGFYTYDNVVMGKTGEDKVMVTCPKHGDFPTYPHQHMAGGGCKNCAIENSKLTKDEFIEKAKEIHKDEFGNSKYTYDNVEYLNANTNVMITCPIHGDFPQKPGNHLNGQGCGKCNESKGEKKLRDYFRKNNINFEGQKSFSGCFTFSDKKKRCFKLPFDFYLQERKILIEVDGEQHFKPFFGDERLERQIFNDKVKNKFAISDSQINKLIRIYYNGRNINYLISELERLLNTESSEKILLSKDYPKAGWNK
jgi:hypothetical protein